MTARVPVAHLTETAGEVRHGMRDILYDAVEHVFVVDAAGRFCGVVPHAALLPAAAHTPVSALMAPTWPQVAPELHREAAGSLAIHHDVSSLAVCDASGRFLGAVTGRALLSILRDEHLEDLHQMAGIVSSSEGARAAMNAAPHRRAAYRLPWLLVGMIGSGLTTMLMAGFEAQLTAYVTVGFFVPAIVYLADAVGTQSEAVAVRSLSLGTNEVRRLIGSELVTGLLIGAALGSIAFPLVWLGFGDLWLAASVTLALIAACSVATSLGFLLPLLFARGGYDPALGSGPVATVIQDVLSILIYFVIVSKLMF